MDRLAVQASVSCDAMQLTGTGLDELLGDDRVDGVHVVRSFGGVVVGAESGRHYGRSW
jgi:hypothetical protein